MFSLRYTLLPLGFAALALLPLAGCGEDSYASSGDPYVVSNVIGLSPVAPPPVTDDAMPALANPRTQAWRPGYWDYDGRSFSWVSGEVLTRPSATAVWSPDRWERRAYGWAFIHGYWQ